MYHHYWTCVQVHASGPYTACAPELPCLKCIACILFWSMHPRFAGPVVFSILLQIHRLQVRERCQWLLGLYSRAYVQSLLSLCSTIDMTQMLRLHSGACALALLKSYFVTCLCHLWPYAVSSWATAISQQSRLYVMWTLSSDSGSCVLLLLSVRLEHVCREHLSFSLEHIWHL